MKRTKCEVYSRVVGYLRPIQQWNEGKQAEWKDRKTFECEDLEKHKNTGEKELKEEIAVLQ